MITTDGLQESGWTREEFEAHDRGETRIRRFFSALIDHLLKHCDELDQAHAAISGIKIGAFVRVASRPRLGRLDLEVPTSARAAEASAEWRFLHRTAASFTFADDSRFVGDSAHKTVGLIRLAQDGELFGLIAVRGPSDRESSCWGFLRASAAQIAQSAAEAVFSMRVRQVAEPIELAEDLSEYYDEVARRTSLDFGADGAVLRTLNRENGYLEVAAYAGEVPSALLTSRVPGEGLSGAILQTPGDAYYASFGKPPEEISSQGISIQERTRAQFPDNGVESYFIMKLRDPSRRTSTMDGIGTLSYSFQRPHRVSWRDVSLFSAHCRRIASTLILRHIAAELQTANDRLRIQNVTATRSEIASLLAHDLGHKAIAASREVENFIGQAKKALRERRSPQFIEQNKLPMIAAVKHVEYSLVQLRQLSAKNLNQLEQPTTFELSSVVTTVSETMRGILARNHIQIEAQYRDSKYIHGRREVLAQVLFNLVVNAIEEIRKLNEKTRKVVDRFIHIHSHRTTAVEGDSMIINIWDDGPGIDRNRYPNPNRIFELGETSKVQGSGMGLPVSRTLLGQFFQGWITLEDPDRALFRIVMPQRAGREAE